MVQHFLDDFDRNGFYTGFCYCGFEFQRMENEYLRKSFHLNDEDGGVLVKKVGLGEIFSFESHLSKPR